MIKATYIMPHPPILIPEIGQGSEHVCDSTLEGLDKLAKEVKSIKPKTIIVITPHGPVFSDGLAIGYEQRLVGNLGSFGHDEISISKDNNLKLVDKIIYEGGKIGVNCLKLDKKSADYYGISSDLDHGTIVPLYFIEKYYSDYNLVHITYGLFSSDKLYEFGTIIKNCVETFGDDTIIISSGDMSHKLLDKGPYEFHKSGPKFDKLISELLIEKDNVKTIFMDKKLCSEAGECGKRSIDIMLGTLNGYDYNVTKYSYEGPFGVGYLVMGFNNIKEDKSRDILKEIKAFKIGRDEKKRANESNYVRLARRAIENYLQVNNDPILDDTMPSEMFEARAGVFVSLKKDGALRGCIGTIGPTQDNIALEVISNAIKAACEDPRFPKLEVEELNELTITVDVLLEPEVIDDVDLLDTKKYGVIVSTDHKRGVLLPNLEGIDTIEEQIRIAKQKGSINEDEDFILERFEVIRYH